MTNYATSQEIDQTLLDLSASRLNVQRRVVSAMETGDPDLLRACALLRQMEQSTAMANISFAITSYNHSVEYNPISCLG